MIVDTIPQLRSLPAQAKFELVAELWEDVLRHEDEIMDPPGIAAVLEERLASYRAGQTTGKSWEEVRTLIQNRS